MSFDGGGYVIKERSSTQEEEEQNTKHKTLLSTCNFLQLPFQYLQSNHVPGITNLLILM